MSAARFFRSPAVLRRWLEKHHRSARELLVGLHRRHSGKPSITWPQLVDEVLCFGWIDGIRKTIDADRYSIRITPRTPTSTWSNVNVRRVRDLKALGRMTPAGEKAFRARTAGRTGRYAYENRPTQLGAAYRKRFRANPGAWAFFRAQAPWYRRVCSYWVMSAKKEETRLRRLAQLMRDSAAGRRLGLLERNRKRGA